MTFMDTIIFLLMLYYFCCSCHFCNQNCRLFQNQSRCHFRGCPHQSHLHNYCNIDPCHIRIPQSNSPDYKISPCRIQVTEFSGSTHCRRDRFIPWDSFFFFRTNCECLVAFNLSGRLILCKLC